MKKGCWAPTNWFFPFYGTSHPGIYNKINKQKLQNSEDLLNMIMYTYLIKMYEKKSFEHSKIDFSTFSTYFTVQLTTLNCIPHSWLHGVMGSIAAFQAVDPGSTPVRVMEFIHIFSFYNIYILKIPIKNYIKVTPPNIYYAINMLIYKCIIRNLQKKYFDPQQIDFSLLWHISPHSF